MLLELDKRQLTDWNLVKVQTRGYQDGDTIQGASRGALQGPKRETLFQRPCYV